MALKRILRWAALVIAAVYGTSFLLHVFSYPKEDVPAEILSAVIFLCAAAAYFYLSRNLRTTPK